jgi:hypothetical protein
LEEEDKNQICEKAPGISRNYIEAPSSVLIWKFFIKAPVEEKEKVISFIK